MTRRPKLRPHGFYVKPHYAPAPGEVASWAGKSTDEERPDGNNSGIVKRHDKKQQASEATHALGLIAQQYGDAIKYTARLPGLHCLSLIAGLVALGLIALFAPMAVEAISWGDGFAITLGGVFLVGSILAGTTIFLWSARLELFRPIDEPTIFDRKNRKVYRIFCEAQPG